jgi:hypothetical protein
MALSKSYEVFRRGPSLEMRLQFDFGDRPISHVRGRVDNVVGSIAESSDPDVVLLLAQPGESEASASDAPMHTMSPDAFTDDSWFLPVGMEWTSTEEEFVFLVPDPKHPGSDCRVLAKLTDLFRVFENEEPIQLMHLPALAIPASEASRQLVAAMMHARNSPEAYKMLERSIHSIGDETFLMTDTDAAAKKLLQRAGWDTLNFADPTHAAAIATAQVRVTSRLLQIATGMPERDFAQLVDNVPLVSSERLAFVATAIVKSAKATRNTR